RSAPRLLLSLTAPTTPLGYPLSLHDALPISVSLSTAAVSARFLLRVQNWLAMVVSTPEDSTATARVTRAEVSIRLRHPGGGGAVDRKSTRLNSSHDQISYAVFCLKKKNTQTR